MIVAAVPVKALAQAKSRLAGHMSERERERLVERLLDSLVEALRDSGVIDRIAVVTSDQRVARDLVVDRIPDAGTLNDSLAAAVQWALSLGAAKLLIVPGDLPRVRSQDVRDLVLGDPNVYGVAIAPTRDGGTGALLLTPPNIIPPSFGRGSFERHLALAHLQGVRADRVESDAFAFDVDTPEDLALL